ncbi:hypothetical protein E1293_42405 [Actinomadura darangshiensis]|uniref:Uncharacterized protein n=1 Tax=Actinomadura darangshiensis TaxID=705336 RepID=A0A4R4ZYS7_9ACTN|nr:hypothetical protein [Actinomadura darangshiensis]TDD63820.1 hypothetical protein E1293_42405 [Actinomadura darangshiensis]
MQVTDRQLATLRSQLAGRTAEEHLRLFNQLGESDNAGYAALLAAGLFEAIQRRFAKSNHASQQTEIIDFIAASRERSEEAPDAIDPNIAEQIILHALGKGTIAGIDGKAVIRHQIMLLAALTAQARYNEEELDAFLSQVRADAEEMLE